jgi:hypothetical protein
MTRGIVAAAALGLIATLAGFSLVSSGEDAVAKCGTVRCSGARGAGGGFAACGGCVAPAPEEKPEPVAECGSCLASEEPEVVLADCGGC